MTTDQLMRIQLDNTQELADAKRLGYLPARETEAVTALLAHIRKLEKERGRLRAALEAIGRDVIWAYELARGVLDEKVKS